MKNNFNDTPEVSILMSIYDGDKLEFIKETFDSLDNQTFKNFEAIIIFDGIKNILLRDSIRSLLNEVEFKYNLIENDENNGLAFCLNMAIKNANGNFFARIDADDIMLPERLSHQIEYLNNNTSIDIVG